MISRTTPRRLRAIGLSVAASASPLVGALLPAQALADEEAPSVAVASDLPSAYRDWKRDLVTTGIAYTINYTSEELTAVSGGDSSALAHAGQLSFTGQADMDKIAGWKGASVTVSVSKRDGQGINARSGIGALLGPQEIFGRGNITRISQFWLDQNLFKGRVSLRAGRGNAGSDFEEFDCNFINLSYCGNQVGNVVSDYWYNYPISQWAVITTIHTTPKSYFKVGAYQVNKRNLGRSLLGPLKPGGGSGVLVPAELGWKSRSGSAGTSVKLGAWYSTAERADVYLDRQRQSVAQTGQPFLQRSGSYGSYLSVVARMAPSGEDRPERLTAFFNAVAADSRTSTVDRSLAAGLVFSGFVPGRLKDQIGIAVSANHLNRRLLDYRVEQGSVEPGTAMSKTGENAVELFYGFQVTSYLQFRPDFQWVHNPGGTSPGRDALILGARTSITI